MALQPYVGGGDAGQAIILHQQITAEEHEKRVKQARTRGCMACVGSSRDGTPQSLRWGRCGPGSLCCAEVPGAWLAPVPAAQLAAVAPPPAAAAG